MTNYLNAYTSKWDIMSQLSALITDSQSKADISHKSSDGDSKVYAATMALLLASSFLPATTALELSTRPNRLKRLDNGSNSRLKTGRSFDSRLDHCVLHNGFEDRSGLDVTDIKQRVFPDYQYSAQSMQNNKRKIDIPFYDSTTEYFCYSLKYHNTDYQYRFLNLENMAFKTMYEDYDEQFYIDLTQAINRIPKECGFKKLSDDIRATASDGSCAPNQNNTVVTYAEINNQSFLFWQPSQKSIELRRRADQSANPEAERCVSRAINQINELIQKFYESERRQAFHHYATYGLFAAVGGVAAGAASYGIYQLCAGQNRRQSPQEHGGSGYANETTPLMNEQ